MELIADKDRTAPPAFDRQRKTPCQVCGGPVAQPERQGRPRVTHEECGEVLRSMRRLEAALKRAQEARTFTGRLSVEDIRSRLFDMANSLPRWRDISGRFKSGRR